MRIFEPCSQSPRLAAADSEAPFTQYVIVRKDLPLGHIAAQVAHAAGAGSVRHPPGTYVVVLAAESEQQLGQIAERLAAHGIAHTVVDECDGVYAGQRMSIGLELLRDRTAVRKAVSSLPLLR